MRISSRGTVSMGPVGWLIAGPFILMFWMVYGLACVLIALVSWLAARDWGSLWAKVAGR